MSKRTKEKVTGIGRMMRTGMAMLLVITVCLSNAPLIAQASSTLDKLNQAQNEKKKTESQLNQANQQIDGLEDVKDDLQGELNHLSRQLHTVTENLADLEEQIDKKEEEIEETQADLDEAKITERAQYESMKERIRFMYEKRESAYLEMVFSSSNFSDFLNRAEYINKITEYDRKMLIEYQAIRTKIEEEEAKLVQDKQDLDETKIKAQEQQALATAAVNTTSTHIAGYTNQISAAEEQALIIENKMKQQENDIATLKKQYEQELALSKQAAQSAKRDISEVTFAEGDLQMLATIIYCEAGGEPYAGKLAVGAVVINRVLSSRYPNTVVGVIYQRKQFSPVGSGRFELALANGSANSSCYQAAQEAMNGMTNVGGCVYFRTPIEGLTGLQIGGHIFY
ncbi:MAG: cell wall hydrolase [Lachnospiraceae bacterium]